MSRVNEKTKFPENFSKNFWKTRESFPPAPQGDFEYISGCRLAVGRCRQWLCISLYKKRIYSVAMRFDDFACASGRAVSRGGKEIRVVAGGV